MKGVPPYTILAPNVAIIFGISERSEEEFLFLSSSEFIDASIFPVMREQMIVSDFNV
ncbi:MULTISPECIES: hypothetical protein [unclassified Bartonella]|uniref:hypothetical protein n=1 Tax=unclassified Bartonella TaxID=2645622 RepID=UPI0035CF2038